MLRLLLYVTVLAATVYGLFFVKLEGRPVSAHLADIWHSPTVQQKMRLVENSVGVGREPARPAPAERTPDKRATADNRPAKPHGARAPAHPAHDEQSEKERKSLDALVDQVQKSAK